MPRRPHGFVTNTARRLLADGVATPRQLADQAGVSMHLATSTLTQLVKRGEARRVARGRYAATSQMSTPPPAAETAAETWPERIGAIPLPDDTGFIVNETDGEIWHLRRLTG